MIVKLNSDNKPDIPINEDMLDSLHVVSAVIRGALKTLPNIYDRGFLRKQLSAKCLPLTIIEKNIFIDI